MRVTRSQGPITALPRPAQKGRDERVCLGYCVTVQNDEASTLTREVRRPMTRSVALTLSIFVLGSGLFATVVGIATASLQAIPLATSATVSSGGEALAITLAHAMSLIMWLWPLTTVGAATGAWVALRPDTPGQTGVLAVAIGAVVGALAATQLMPPADALSHELAAWAVLAPAAAVLLAIAPWPGAVVHDLPLGD